MSAAMKGPLRSAATETTTTIVAGIATLRARAYQKNGSGDMIPRRHCRPRHDAPEPAGVRQRSGALELHLDRRTAPERLVDHAIALGELEQRVELVLRRVGLDVEAQANRRKTDRRILGHAERAAKVEIAFGRYLGGLERNVEGGRDRLERHAGAGDQCLQQHVAGTKLEPGAAGGGMQARDRERAGGLHLAGNVSIIERALGLQGDISGLRVALVALLERRLHGAQRSGVHWKPPFRTAEDRRQPRGKSKPVVRGPATGKSYVLCCAPCVTTTARRRRRRGSRRRRSPPRGRASGRAPRVRDA